MALLPGTQIVIDRAGDQFDGYRGTVLPADEHTLPGVKVHLPVQHGWIHGHTLYLTNGDVKRHTLTISGEQAASIKRHVRSNPAVYRSTNWAEVQIMDDECGHGCKLMHRRRGCVDEYAVLHYRGYGCKLDTPGGRWVPVKLAA